VSRVIPARGSQENDGVVVGSDGFSVHCLKACAVSLLGATRWRGLRRWYSGPTCMGESRPHRPQRLFGGFRWSSHSITCLMGSSLSKRPFLHRSFSY